MGSDTAKHFRTYIPLCGAGARRGACAGMNEKAVSTPEQLSPGKLVQPSLVFSRFATNAHGILLGLLLVDIGLTFGVPVGVAGQIRTASSVMGVICALLMGVLSIRFRHKSLLLIGLLLLTISALACAFAPSFLAMLMFFSIWGVAQAIAEPMTLTLTGEHFPQEMRASVIGWITAGAAIAYLVGAPAIGFLAGLGGWRLAFLGFVLPVSLGSLVLATKGVPTTPRSHHASHSLGEYLAGFTAVFSHRSADACLAGSALSMASWMAILTYSPSFYRQRFLISTGYASIYVLATAVGYVLGSVVGGRLVKRVGRKPLTVLAALFAGIFTASFTMVPDLWLSMMAAFLACVSAGMRVAASDSLTLEQVPKFRGTLMSISTAASSLGASLGVGIAGATLLSFDYEGVGVSLGVMGIAAAMVFGFLAIDPTRTEQGRPLQLEGHA